MSAMLPIAAIVLVVYLSVRVALAEQERDALRRILEQTWDVEE